MRSANRLNNILLWFLLGSVTASLLTGGITFLNSADLVPYWTALSIAATIASIVGVAKRPSDGIFLHFDTARAFDGLAAKVENFTNFAVHVTGADNIDESAAEMHREYTALLDRTGAEHRDYGNKNTKAITDRLQGILKVEKLIK